MASMLALCPTATRKHSGDSGAPEPTTAIVALTPITGSVTATQRFGPALNLNPHLHALSLHGVYVRRSPTGPLHFVRLRALTDAALTEVLNELVTWLHKALIRRGLSDLAQQPSPDALALQQLALASAAGQSPHVMG